MNANRVKQAVIVASAMITAFVVIGCSKQVPITKYEYIIVTDTVKQYDIDVIVGLKHELNLCRDSLNAIKDSIGEELFIARYKLARIKYYNNIAAKGNNIKFLRGWINRVINE